MSLTEEEESEEDLLGLISRNPLFIKSMSLTEEEEEEDKTIDRPSRNPLFIKSMSLTVSTLLKKAWIISVAILYSSSLCLSPMSLTLGVVKKFSRNPLFIKSMSLTNYPAINGGKEL